MESSRTFARLCAKSSKSLTKRILVASLATTFTFSGLAAPLTELADAASVNLSWNASTSSGVKGYKVGYGTTSGNFSQFIDVGNTTSYTINNLADGNTYYFAAVAYDTAGNQSSYSNQVSANIAAAPATYSITATAGAGGSIAALNNTRVSSATSGSNTISTVTVNGGANQSFSITPSSGYKIAGVSVNGASVGAVSSYTFNNVNANQTITATFASNTAASYTITASAGTGGTISPAGTATVTSGGSATYTIAPNSGYNIADVKVNGTSVGAVSTFTFTNVTANNTIAASFTANNTASSTIWPSTAVPRYTQNAGTPLEVGVKFTSSQNGYITGLRFYKAPANTGTHVASLWTSTGQLLARATFTNETASGWQQVNFSTPVSITRGTVYVASCFSPSGYYSVDRGYFTGKGVSGPVLYAAFDGQWGVNGVYRYTNSSAFPSQGYQGSNYWVDVVFKP